MAVERVAHLTIDARGPGVGQRDQWNGQAKLRMEGRGEVRIERSPGMTGDVAYVKLDDLEEAVRQLRAVA